MLYGRYGGEPRIDLIDLISGVVRLCLTRLSEDTPVLVEAMAPRCQSVALEPQAQRSTEDNEAGGVAGQGPWLPV
jgi:hypothetical protein